MVWIKNWDATLLLAALVNRPLEPAILKKMSGNELSTAAIALLPLDRPIRPTRMSCGL